MGAWLVLGAYVALVYGLLPYGPPLGAWVQATTVGRVALGPGAPWIAGALVLALVLRLRRRGASPGAYVLAALAALGCAVGLGWLRAIRLERVHLPEYAIATCLAWRAIAPATGDRAARYVAAAVLAALLGWGDELLQGITPGRVYDIRDVAANALGASVGAVALAAWRAGNPISGEGPSSPC